MSSASEAADMLGSLFIVSAPSGAGKSTLVNALLAEDGQLGLSVSHTTRAPRGSEVDGREYHFVTREVFVAMRERGEFLESAEVHGNLYGTSRSWIESQVAGGRDVVFEIDCQGAEQLRAVFPDALAIFILPPSMNELERRLRGRGTDDEEIVARRLRAAVLEMRRAPNFDYVIINADFSDALKRLQSVVTAARQRVAQVGAREHELFANLSINIV
jgi:guanylate kinase